MADEQKPDDLGKDELNIDQPESKPSVLKIIIKILNYVALVVGAIILIVTTVIITINIMGRGNQTRNLASISPEYQGSAPNYAYYALSQIRTRTSDKVAHSIVIRVELGYTESNQALRAELVQRTPKLTDLIRNYFSSKLVTDLTPENEGQLKAELKDMVNRTLSSGQIEDVIFPEFQVFDF